MLRNLVRNFENALKLHSSLRPIPNVISRQRTLFTQFDGNTKPMRNGFAASATSTCTMTPPVLHSTVDTDGEADVERPYIAELESGVKASVLKNALRERFRLSDKELDHILSDEQVVRSYRTRSLTQVLDTLQMLGITKRSFVENPWLLALDEKRLDLKLQLIKTMHMRDVNHFVPFLRLTVPRLRKLVSALNAERNTIPHMNRIYYISEKLQINPAVVTKYLAKRLFILEMPFEMFEKNLQHMIDYNVSSINILKDLWAFRYTPRSVQLRLERAKRAKKDKIMPWMVRCPEPILQRSFKLTLDELQVLGEFSSVVEYVAHRLGFTVQEAKAIMDRHPQVHTVRVTKIKEVLDYLLNDAKFSRFEIAQVPRILCHSLRTTKERFNELQSLGCRPSTLVILCRSKREYDKFLQNWMSLKNNNNNNNVTSEEVTS